MEQELVTVEEVRGRVQWKIREPRPAHHGYTDPDDEQIAGAFVSLRIQAGFPTTESFAEHMMTCGASELPSVLLDAIEFPAVSMIDYIDALAECFGVSPGTLLDELLLRASGADVEGYPPDEDDS